MKRLSLILALYGFGSVLLTAQTPTSNNQISTPSVPPATPNLSTPAPRAATVPTPVPVALPAATPVPLVSLAPPADIASLTAKEILAQNNAVVGQVATMYEHFGFFITAIVTLVGGIATLWSYLARKSVHEFIADWKQKFEAKDKEIDAARDRAKDAELEAGKSAAQAQADAQVVQTTSKVLNNALLQVDELRTQVDTLRERLASLTNEVREPVAVAAVAVEAPVVAPPPTAGDNVGEAISPSEEASVDERLRGRLPENPEAP